MQLFNDWLLHAFTGVSALMQALILAAGVGSRLSLAVDERPKCLLEFDGVTLLERHIRMLSGAGIGDITIVTGYKAELIDKELGKFSNASTRLKTIRNSDYREGNVVSLWTGREVLASGDDVLLMDADVLCSGRIIEALANSDHDNCLLLDRDFEPGDEPVKLCINNGRIVEFRKIIAANANFDLQGESVGFFRFSPQGCRLILQQAESYISGNRRDQPYEEVLRDVVTSRPDMFGYEDISGLPWIEIDFPEDIERARYAILPRIQAENVQG